MSHKYASADDTKKKEIVMGSLFDLTALRRALAAVSKSCLLQSGCLHLINGESSVFIV